MQLFDPATSALVLIDLQGAVRTHAAEPHSADDVITRSLRLIDAMRAAGGLVIYVRTSFLPDESDSLQPLRIEKMRPAKPHRPAGWDQLVDELAPLPTEPIIIKRSWNAFHGSDLDVQLRRHGVKTVVMAGISTNFGVEGTARAAYELSYELVFVEDVMATNTADNHEFALREVFPQLGRVRSLDDVLETLAGEAAA
ncbi:isochorismatase family protein [Agromyces aerolatus]|uniref:isochorismatase family protein n=1 Tax=Agromyces sp. LY-1074 TaxID=3074080 RepID=UPI002864E33A|nr:MULTISPECIES: isochorismatase family protein [unclassified Agromyces]MDR5701397.1 isochorismatase family protein [Agromyces sp. LY-1074]MDR5706814.1 isochorismatase family protein [Agromyces sp. LY-1358]